MMSGLSRDEYLQAMRGMAWERAKGELNSVGHASFSGGDDVKRKDIERYLSLLKEFIRTVEDEGLIE